MYISGRYAYIKISGFDVNNLVSNGAFINCGPVHLLHHLIAKENAMFIGRVSELPVF